MSSFRYDPATAIAETDRGPVRGYAWHGLHVFKGIPYAAARRFRAPEPVKKREEVSVRCFPRTGPRAKSTCPTGSGPRMRTV